jgi:hypothetical protein
MFSAGNAGGRGPAAAILPERDSQFNAIGCLAAIFPARSPGADWPAPLTSGNEAGNAVIIKFEYQ